MNEIDMSNRTTIGLITNWYPTKENPIAGSFFKEQAFATSDKYDYVVLRYIERKTLGLKYLLKLITKKTFEFEMINEEKNTKEYMFVVYYPILIDILNKLRTFYNWRFKHISVIGVGSYKSNTYIKMKKNYLRKVLLNEFKDSIDVFYCVDGQLEASTIQYASEITDKPYIVGEHAPFPWPGSTLINIEKEAIEKSDLFLAISHDKIRQVLLQNVKLNKIRYIGNLVDESLFKLKECKNEIPTFIIVAAHSFYKNYNLFIEIFNKLVAITNKDFRVMVVGYNANKGYSKNAEELENKILKSKFGDKAILIPEVSRNNISDVYSKADVFIMTSIQEGMPVSALEAACCGLPIYSTRCGGVEDYVDENIGRIFKMNDSESFAIELKKYLDGETNFDSSYIRNTIISKYGKNAFVENFDNAVQDTIKAYKQ